MKHATPNSEFDDAQSLKTSESDSDRARSKADRELHEAAARMRSGDHSAAANMRFPKTGQTTRGLEAGQGHHYLELPQDDGSLLADRFDWWHAEPPGKDLDPLNDTSSTNQQRECEFLPALTTVVGGRLDDLMPFRPILGNQWDHLFENESVNVLPDLQFVVRESTDTLLQVSTKYVKADGRSDSTKVLVHKSKHQIPADKSTPSLFIDFLYPQRAVELQYGYLPIEGRENIQIYGHNVQLYAYDHDGRVVARSDGGHLLQDFQGPPQLSPSQVDHRIGVIAYGGNITTVELQFTKTDDGIPIIEPQLIYRIWHEAFPPAVVSQETIDTDLISPEITLPFHCSQFALMLRGFKFEFTDDQPHEMQVFRLNLVPQTVNAEGTKLKLLPHVQVVAAGNPPYRVKFYYSLLAWDERQVDLRVTQRGTASQRTLEGYSYSHLEVASPLDTESAEFRPELWEPQIGAVNGFGFSLGEIQEVEHLEFSVQSPTRAGAPGDKLWLPAVARLVGSEDVLHYWNFSGSILMGRGILKEQRGDLRTWYIAGGPRPDDASFNLVPPEERFRFEFEADLAVVSLDWFRFNPNGPVRELEIEVKGHSYDGENVLWKMGGGGARSPRNDPDDNVLAMGRPCVAAIVRPRPFSFRRRLRYQPLSFAETPRDFIAHRPMQLGAIQNIGDAPVLITGVQKGGPHADEFRFRILLNQLQTDIGRVPFPPLRGRGRLDHDDGWLNNPPLVRQVVVSETEFAAYAPYLLRHGETLLISGIFSPQAVGYRWASLTFVTNDPKARLLPIDATGEAVFPRSQGHWVPDSMNFGRVLLNSPVTRIVLYESVGADPLLMRSLRLEKGNVGFSFEIRAILPGNDVGLVPQSDPQRPSEMIGPGGFVELVLTFHPVQPGVVTDRLLIEINPGVGTPLLPLHGEGYA